MKTTVLTAMALLATSGASAAQVSADFETASGYTGSPAGTLLTGQNGWYLPAVAGSVDWNCYTYAGNALNFAVNPTGGAQFAGGITQGAAGANPAREQLPFAFDLTKKYRASFDYTARYNGTLPSAANLGSFSLQPSATNRFWQSLTNWVDVNTAAAFNIAFLPFNASGVQAAQPGLLPSPTWGAIPVDTWMHVSVEWDFATNKMTRLCITKIPGGTEECTDVVDWYLSGGAAPTQPAPTDIRFFSGGQTGNANAYDNFKLEEVTDGCYPDCDGDTVLSIDDFICFQTFFALGDPYADCDGDTQLSIDDFICFQTFFAIGCG